MLIINVFLVQAVSVVLLIYIYRRRGIGETLPYYIFFMVFFPSIVQFDFFGLFDFTIQRAVTSTMLVLAILSLKQNTISPKIELKYLIIALIAWSFLANAYSIVPVISFKRMMAYVLEYFALFFILSRYLTSTAVIRKIFISLQVAVFLACILGLVEYMNGWSLNNLFPSEAGRFSFLDRSVVARQGRLKSVFPHPILFGSAIAMTLPITFHFIVTARNRILKAALWTGLALMFFCLYKTTSRGPWLAAGIALVLLFVFYQPTRRYILGIAVAGVLVLYLRPGIWMSLRNIFMATFDPTTALGGSYEYRYALIDVTLGALHESIQRILLGYGQDAFFYLGLEAEFDGRIHRFLSMDSAWAKILFELGYVGFFISLIIFVKALADAFRNFYRFFNTPWARHFIIYAAMMIVFFFMMTNVAIYGWGPHGYILWAAIAMSYSHAQIIETAFGFYKTRRKPRKEAVAVT